MPSTLGVILGNRDFFPDALISEARQQLTTLFSLLDVTPIWLTQGQTKLGDVQGWTDAVKCGALFRAHRSEIEGILVCLPNFGDEKALSDAIRLSELNVPILVQACPDDLDAFGLERRRDAFCGKISACNNLRQYGYKYTLTRDHTVAINSDRFREDLTNDGVVYHGGVVASVIDTRLRPAQRFWAPRARARSTRICRIDRAAIPTKCRSSCHGVPAPASRM